MFIVDGNGESSFDPDKIEVYVDPAPVTLPGELQAFRKRIEQRELAKRERGEQYFWNGARFAVASVAVTRTGLTEESEIRIGFRPSDYYNFRTIQESIDEFIPKYDKTLRDQYLSPFYWNRPVPFLSSSFGVNVILITRDGDLIITQRSEVVGSRPNQYSVSANEGLSRGVDDAGGNPPDLYECAYRALKEELGIRKGDLQIEHSHAERYKILAFGVDL